MNLLLFSNELKFLVWEAGVAVTHTNKRSCGASAVFKNVKSPEIQRCERHLSETPFQAEDVRCASYSEVQPELFCSVLESPVDDSVTLFP